MKTRKNTKAILPQLPTDFDRSRIVMSDVRGPRGRTIRLNGCDFNPMKRRSFKGFFALPDNVCIGTRHRLSERVGSIVASGGSARIVENRRKTEARRADVVISEAWRDGNDYVVMHMEPMA